jgi:hypothetical protein
MAEPDKKPVTLEELLVSRLAQTDALATLLIEKGLITWEELCRRFRRDGNSQTEEIWLKIRRFTGHFYWQ